MFRAVERGNNTIDVCMHDEIADIICVFTFVYRSFESLSTPRTDNNCRTSRIICV